MKLSELSVLLGLVVATGCSSSDGDGGESNEAVQGVDGYCETIHSTCPQVGQTVDDCKRDVGEEATAVAKNGCRAPLEKFYACVMANGVTCDADGNADYADACDGPSSDLHTCNGG